jgi:hypothetical protein
VLKVVIRIPVTVTDHPWFETRSGICAAGKYENLHLKELIINVGLQAKIIPVFIQNIETLGRVWTSRLLLSL